MRILMTHNFHRFGGGSDDSVRTTAETLRAAGHDVEMFARDSASVVGLGRQMTAAASSVYAPAALREFRSALRAFRPDIVHVHEVFPLLSPWVLRTAVRARVPTVMTCHDYRLTCPIATHYLRGSVCTACLERNEMMCVRNNCRDNRAESVSYALRSFAARSASAFTDNVSVYVTATRFAKDWLTERGGLDASRVRVVPYPIGYAEEPIDSSAGSYVAYAGRFVAEKGIDTLLQACELSGLPVRLAGDSSTMPELSSTERVRLVGQLGTLKLAEFYRTARFLVVPSTWFETFGIVAGEAMGLGLPVIASKIGALAEVVDDGRTGLLFAAGDAADLAEKMQTLWNDPALCAEMGRAGWNKVRGEFSPECHLAGIVGAYEHAISLGIPDRRR